MYRIKATNLSGTVVIPPSKSYLHRALMAAALSKETSVIHNVRLSDDIRATIDFIKSIGADIKLEGTKAIIIGYTHSVKKELHANESGTTLRLSMPLLMHLNNGCRVYCKQSLIVRPMDVYESLFGEVDKTEDAYIVNNVIKSGRYIVDGSKSSQFISGLLFTLPLLEGDSQIEISGELTSEPYIQITIDVLKDFGIVINYDEKQRLFTIKGNQTYKAVDNYFVEGDYSQAAFFLVANKLGSNIKIEGLNENSIQGDRHIIRFLESNGNDIDVTDTPDLVPVLSVYLSTLPFNTLLVGTNRLQYKESNRAVSTKCLVEALGGKVDINDNSMLIYGNTKLRGAEVSAFNDHRLAMSACIAATVCDGEIELDNIKCIDKSYTDFIEEYKKLGGSVNVK